ncbi:MAG TPA: DUF4349 domain-containing protein [Cyclobacteriaceae bacterium]|nr:DUF4349 domain-containing protein [Cyclobacteriaceae bacterium]
MNLILGIFILMFSCNEKNNDVNYALAPVAEMAMDRKISEQPAQATDISVERKLIRNGQLDFKSSDVKKTKIEIEKISKELNAYISSENESNYENRLQYTQTIRVPADQFDNLIYRLEPLADKIENKSINTQDVTEEFIDVEARLTTKKELEARFREILKQAKTVEEIVSIESQIANVRAEIESMEGRLKYLQNQVSFSTLNVSYYEIIGTDFGFASKFVESLKGGWDNLLSFLIFLVTLWPFVVGLIALVFWWVRRRNRRALKP